jgi:hypothetical protein
MLTPGRVKEWQGASGCCEGGVQPLSGREDISASDVVPSRGGLDFERLLLVQGRDSVRIHECVLPVQFREETNTLPITSPY